MLLALVELLEDKGVLTQDEWERKIREKIHSRGVLGYRDIQFNNEET